MSDDDSIFLGTDEPIEDVAGWLADVLGLEPAPDATDAEEAEVRLVGAARSVEGRLGFLVERNGYAIIDPEPDEVEAIAGYPIYVDIWYASARDSRVQAREARLVFDRLVEARPEVPILLCHNMTLLNAAHLPGKGTQYFDDVSVDAPDLEIWRDWVPNPPA